MNQTKTLSSNSLASTLRRSSFLGGLLYISFLLLGGAPGEQETLARSAHRRLEHPSALAPTSLHVISATTDGAQEEGLLSMDRVFVVGIGGISLFFVLYSWLFMQEKEELPDAQCDPLDAMRTSIGTLQSSQEPSLEDKINTIVTAGIMAIPCSDMEYPAQKATWAAKKREVLASVSKVVADWSQQESSKKTAASLVVALREAIAGNNSFRGYDGSKIKGRSKRLILPCCVRERAKRALGA